MSNKPKSNKPLTPNKNSLAFYKEFKPRTKNQANFIRTIIENDITLSNSPAGTSKTNLAIGIALEHLKDNKIKKIIILRPTVEASKRGLGFLKGSYQDKLQPYMIPLLEQIEYYIGKSKLEYLLQNNIIQIDAIEFFRGRNVSDAYIILDEAQNATEKQIKLIMTRLCENSKLIIIGDSDQVDLPINESGALQKIISLLYEVEGVGIANMDYTDVQRLPIVKKILEIFAKNLNDGV